jgi:hypothetical protein
MRVWTWWTVTGRVTVSTKGAASPAPQPGVQVHVTSQVTVPCSGQVPPLLVWSYR